MHKLLTVPQVLSFLPACKFLSTIMFPTTSFRIAVDLISPTKTDTVNWGHTSQKPVNRAWISNYSPQSVVGCNYLSMHYMPASGTCFLNWGGGHRDRCVWVTDSWKNDVSMYHGRGLSKGTSLSTIFTNVFYNREYGPGGHHKDCYPSTLP